MRRCVFNAAPRPRCTKAPIQLALPDIRRAQEVLLKVVDGVKEAA